MRRSRKIRRGKRWLIEVGEAGEVEGGGEAGVEVSEEGEGEVEGGASRHEVWIRY